MQKFYGKYRGKVVENVDPFICGRLLVNVPSVMGEMENWALPSVPYAGIEVGFLALPPIGANIWVEFEEGDINSPIWTGCFWNKGEAPIMATSPEIKVMKTPGTLIMISDIPGEGGLTIEVGPPVIEEPFTITINATGITTTCLPSIFKVTPEMIQATCAETSTITMTPADINLTTPPSEVTLTVADINIMSGAANINVCEETIDINLGAGMVTVTPATVIVNEGALTIL